MVKVTHHGYPGHFCCAERCRYHRTSVIHIDGMATYLISSVGAMTPTGGIGNGDGEVYDTIGINRFYETMVFKVNPVQEDERGDLLWKMSSGSELDISGLGEEFAFDVADKMHDAAVKKWVKRCDSSNA